MILKTRQVLYCGVLLCLFVFVASAYALEVEVYSFHAGVLKTQTQYMMKDTRVGSPYDIPVPFFVIKHGKDWVAFDIGCNGRVAVDAQKYWGADIIKAYAPVVRPEQEFKNAIKVLGLKPQNFSAVIISHGHLDHAGALDNFLGTNVPIYFQKAEMAEIRKILDVKKAGTAYILDDFKYLNELNIKEIEGIIDLFGDGSVVAFPTPGHTPGHQSLLVKPSKGSPFLYAADALYTLENLERFIGPGLAANMPQAMQNIGWFKVAKLAGLTVIPSHDPEYWKKQSWAPNTFVPAPNVVTHYD